MTTEAEIRGTRPQPKGHRRPRSWQRREAPSPGASRGSGALPHPDLGRLAAGTKRKQTSAALSLPVCVHLFSSPRKLI